MKSLLFTGVSSAGTTASLRRTDGGDERVDDSLDAGVVGDRLKPEDDTVTQHPMGQRLDVLGHDVVATGEDGPGPSRLGERDTPARAGAELDVAGQVGRDVGLRVAGDVDQAHGGGDDRRVSSWRRRTSSMPTTGFWSSRKTPASIR